VGSERTNAGFRGYGRSAGGSDEAEASQSRKKIFDSGEGVGREG
jgi:hypothetical protein